MQAQYASQTHRAAAVSACRRDRSGSAMLAALFIAMIATALVATFLMFSTNSAAITRRAVDYQKAQLAAEAGLDFGLVKLREALLDSPMIPGMTNALQAELNAITYTDTIGPYAPVKSGGRKLFRITVDSDVESCVISNGTACLGAYGDVQRFTITAGAINTNSGVGAVLKKQVQLVGVYLIRYGVFYDDDLEILPGPTMLFTGPVHSNSDIYLGGPLRFTDRLTAHGDIYHRRKDDRTRVGETQIKNASGVYVSMLQGGVWMDSDNASWMSQALKLWDNRVLSGVHGVARLRPPIAPRDDDYTIIERPVTTNAAIARSLPYHVLTTNTVAATTEAEKFANKACLIIAVSNDTLLAWDRADNLVSDDIRSTNYFPAVYITNKVGKKIVVTTNLAYVVTNFYFNETILQATTADYLSTHQIGYAKTNVNGGYALANNGVYNFRQSKCRLGTNTLAYTNRFYDAREATTMMPIDIYVDQLVTIITNHPTLRTDLTNLVYVTCLTNAGYAGTIPCLRLRNGEDLKLLKGLSVVSDLPAYIEGGYNVTNRLSTNNLPALVAGDAVTLLSRNWQDALSTPFACANRDALETEYNTVLMTGNSATTTGHYNGGLENVLRFLEDWGGITVLYRGSIIDLWFSRRVTQPWQSPSTSSYYAAPFRDWGYDEVYRRTAPPGMPRVYGLEDLIWYESTFAAEHW